MEKTDSGSSPVRSFPFWSVMGTALLWSIAISLVGGLLSGVAGVMRWGDHIPLLSSVAQSTKVVGLSFTLAIFATFLACRWFFEEAGVLIGFIILSFGGLLVVGGSLWFGQHAFNFIRMAIAGGLLIPAISFPVTFFAVAKLRD